jgi:Na+/H+ antiporter NhaB
VNTKVDQTALKFNQASIILLLVLAFLLDAAWLVAFVAAVMVVGTIWPQAGLFKQFYARVLKSAGLAQAQRDRRRPAASISLLRVSVESSWC